VYQLISDLHKSEVFKLGKYLGIPESILEAKPSADLWDGQTDEGEIGVSYDFVELFAGWYLDLSAINRKAFVESISDDARKEFEENKALCVKIHNANKHKLTGVVNL